MLKKLSLFVVLTMLLSFSVNASSIKLVNKDNYPVNGVQIFVLDSKYKGNSELLMQELKSKNVDTVFLRVFHNTGSRFHFQEDSRCSSGVYFKTDEACVISDLLGDMVKAGKKYNIKVYAWMATRTLSFLRNKDSMELAFSKNGGIEEGYGINFLHHETRVKIIQLFKDISSSGVDGILFQDDFILKYREGASKRSLYNYYLFSGVNLDFKKLFSCKEGLSETKVPDGCAGYFIPWIKWKNSVLTDFFQELRQASKEINPKIRFAANVYYETPGDDMKGMAWYSQSIANLKKAGFDYFAVMCYHDQISEEMGLDLQGTLKYISNMISILKEEIQDDRRIIMKLQRESFRKGVIITDREFKKVCSLIKRSGNISRVLVPVDRAEEAKDSCFKN